MPTASHYFGIILLFRGPTQRETASSHVRDFLSNTPIIFWRLTLEIPQASATCRARPLNGFQASSSLISGMNRGRIKLLHQAFHAQPTWWTRARCPRYENKINLWGATSSATKFWCFWMHLVFQGCFLFKKSGGSPRKRAFRNGKVLKFVCARSCLQLRCCMISTLCIGSNTSVFTGFLWNSILLDELLPEVDGESPAHRKRRHRNYRECWCNVKREIEVFHTWGLGWGLWASTLTGAYQNSNFDT